MFEQFADDFVVWGERGQSLFVRGVLAGTGFFWRLADFEDIEKDLAELPRRIDVESGARDAADAPFEFVYFFGELGAKIGERDSIDFDAGIFHVHQDWD